MMQLIVEQLVDYLKERLDKLSDHQQYWLGIAGAPGSGKSTLCGELLSHLDDVAVVLPMDGYHYYRAQLGQMPDPQEAHRRRGTPFTFNAQRFVDDLAAARQTGTGNFPSFDHGVGDPVEDDIHLEKDRHKLVIVEGNYLLLNDPPWNRLKAIFDETWFLQVDIETCKHRVRNRFLATGRDQQTAQFRVDYNDGPNAELVNSVSPKNANRILTPP